MLYTEYNMFKHFLISTVLAANGSTTSSAPTDLGQLIQQIFTWSLAVLGIAVFVMFFYAGFLWLTAAGNTARVGEAKDRMTNAIFGAILLLSAYLILNTINPDFVENSFNLPGLRGTSSSPSNEVKIPPPTDALEKHPSQAAIIELVKGELEQEGADLTGPCGALLIIKRSVPRMGGGAGLLSKPAGNQCEGFSSDIIAYPDGYIYDVLIDGGTANKPTWNPSSCGTAQTNGTCPDRYRAAP